MSLTRLFASRAVTASVAQRIANPLSVRSPGVISNARMRRAYSSEQPPKTSDHVLVYRHYGRSFLKLFIGSLAVYSAVYYSWVGLEKDDARRRGDDKTTVSEK